MVNSTCLAPLGRFPMQHSNFHLALTACLLAGSLHGQEPTEPYSSVRGWEAFHEPDGTPKPLNDPADETVWPNTVSHANSDPWIVANHDRIRVMRPRVLVVNLSNESPPDKPLQLVEQLHRALRESSRYHGYRDPKAPAFLEYRVWKYVDLRDAEPKSPISSKAPIKPHVKDGINHDYGAMFDETWARYYGVRDPNDPSRFLRLDELVDRGYVHELQFLAAGSGPLRSLECVELKPRYDEHFARIEGEFVQAGNGGDPDQRWTGRSLRINGMNDTRGIGCAMENYGHSFEGMAHSKAIPYFTKYFHEFAGFDLDRRYAPFPHTSFYPLWGEGKRIEYPDPATAIVHEGETTWKLSPYVAAGGNVHFPPNARRHYDQANEIPVLSTIEDWRIGSGEDGEDIAKPWTIDCLKRYEQLAPDCMGKWLVYWRQNVPGLDNLSKDDEGQPMKNWWVFLFY